MSEERHVHAEIRFSPLTRAHGQGLERRLAWDRALLQDDWNRFFGTRDVVYDLDAIRELGVEYGALQAIASERPQAVDMERARREPRVYLRVLDRLTAVAYSKREEEPAREKLTFDELMGRPATWHSGVPDRTGLHDYTLMIRSPFDPERVLRAERKGKIDAWRKDLRGRARDWAAAIVRLLRDGQSRTFNRIILDLTARQYTADCAGGKPPEEGLWLAVERNLVFWAHLEDGATWFALRPRLRRRGGTG